MGGHIGRQFTQVGRSCVPSVSSGFKLVSVVTELSSRMTNKVDHRRSSLVGEPNGHGDLR